MPTTERLSIRPRENGAVLDLVPLEPAGSPPALTLRVAPDVVLLDALRVEVPGESPVVFATEFSPLAQVSRVCRLPLHPDGSPAREVVFVGAPGDVLWWLRVHDGRLFVREVRRGSTIPLVPLADPSAEVVGAGA